MNELVNPINTIELAGFTSVGLCHYLILSLFLFLCGIIIMVTSKNLVKILIGLEFMLNSICINFAATDTFLLSQKAPIGQVLSLIASAVGAINVSAGLALIIVIYFRLKSIDTTVFCALKSAECPQNRGLDAEETLMEEEI